jgi:hypothetical protein
METFIFETNEHLEASGPFQNVTVNPGLTFHIHNRD